MSSRLTINDPRAAAVFAQSNLRRLLLQFSSEPRNIAEVSRQLKMDLKQMHQTVGKLHRLGLLVIAEERQRAGRAIRLYQAAAQCHLRAGAYFGSAIRARANSDKPCLISWSGFSTSQTAAEKFICCTPAWRSGANTWTQRTIEGQQQTRNVAQKS